MDKGESAKQVYLQIRICDLQLLSRRTGAVGDFSDIDGLYVLLRIENDDVLRTSCLWNSGRDGCGERRDERAGIGGQSGSWMWNELFTVALHRDAGVPSEAKGNPNAGVLANRGAVPGGGGFPPTLHLATPSSLRDSIVPTAPTLLGGQSDIETSPRLSAAAGTQGGFQQPTDGKSSGGGFLFPTIDVELWRSTPLSENCIGRYTYCVPLELLQHGMGGCDSPDDVIVDKVVPLRAAKELPSIMGYYHGFSNPRLGVRVRVQATGLHFATGGTNIGSALLFSSGLLGNAIGSAPPLSSEVLNPQLAPLSVSHALHGSRLSSSPATSSFTSPPPLQLPFPTAMGPGVLSPPHGGMDQGILPSPDQPSTAWTGHPQRPGHFSYPGYTQPPH